MREVNDCSEKEMRFILTIVESLRKAWNQK